MATYTNITGTSAVNVIPRLLGNGNISTLTIANTHTYSYRASVYVRDAADVDYYLVQNLSIEPGSTLVLSGDYLSFNSRNYGLWVKLEEAATGTSTATVINKLKKR
jgi:hypothetical protein